MMNSHEIDIQHLLTTALSDENDEVFYEEKTLPSGIIVRNYATSHQPSDWRIKGTYIFHNEGAPASVHSGGVEMWYNQGKPHRLDGPAISTKSGREVYYIEGKLYSKKDFEMKIKELEYLKLHPDMETFL